MELVLLLYWRFIFQGMSPALFCLLSQNTGFYHGKVMPSFPGIHCSEQIILMATKLSRCLQLGKLFYLSSAVVPKFGPWWVSLSRENMMDCRFPDPLQIYLIISLKVETCNKHSSWFWWLGSLRPSSVMTRAPGFGVL